MDGNGLPETAQPQAPERREFTLAAALAVLGGVTITVSGCGTSGGRSLTGNGSSGSSGVTGAIANNHGHAAQISAAQITASNSLALDIRGGATHTHMVELSASDVERLRTGGTVRVESSVGGDASLGNHEHSVTFGAMGNDPGGY